MSQAATKQSHVVQLEPPRFEDGKALLLAGLRNHYTAETMNDLPLQWQRFAPYIGKIPGQIGRATYGVCWSSYDGVDYLSGVEVSGSMSLPREFSVASIPAERYVVFPHRGHVSRIRETIEAIGSKWFPESGHEPAAKGGETPDFFERYTEDFDPRNGMGGMEIWLPIKS